MRHKKPPFKNRKAIIFIALVLGAFLLLMWLTKMDFVVKGLPISRSQTFYLNLHELKNQYLKDLNTHPKYWRIPEMKSSDSSISIKNSGIKMPDVLAIFQFPDSKWNEWYFTIPIKNLNQWLTFLQQQGFKKIGDFKYIKDSIEIYIFENQAVVSLNSSLNIKNLQDLKSQFFTQTENINTKNQLKSHTAFFSADKFFPISSFNLDIHSHSAIIQSKNFSPNTSLQNDTSTVANFLIREKEIMNLSNFFNDTSLEKINTIAGSLNFFSVKNQAVTYYEFDENFNKIEHSSLKKVYEPEYQIFIHSVATDSLIKTWQNKNWINENLEFVKLPFNENKVGLSAHSLVISTKNGVSKMKKKRFPYSFIEISNLPKDDEFWHEIPIDSKMKNLLKNLEILTLYLRQKEFQLKLQFKKEEPILLLLN